MRRCAAVVGLVLASGVWGCGGGGTAGSSHAESPVYSIAEIGPAGRHSVAYDVNSLGQVVGGSGSESASILAVQAFLWDAGVITDLGGRVARAIADGGEVAGETGGVAYLWRGQTGQALTYGTAHSINNMGHVVGEAVTSDGHVYAFLWQDGEIYDLGTLGGEWSVAHGINDAGQVVGWAETDNRQIRAFFWEDGAMVDLGSLGGEWSMAHAVNNLGQAVGYASTSDGTDRAFLAEPGEGMVDLGSLGGFSIAHDINNLGRVVGESATSEGKTHAFLWQDGEMIDLNDLLPSDSGWELISAVAINDAGQIAGQGIVSGRTRPFLLTPEESVRTGGGPPAGSSWELTFSDEFEGAGLDVTKWSVESGSPGHILSSRWPENIKVGDGVCHLLTKREDRGGREWTTAHIWTTTFRQKYGYFEARMKIGNAPGLNNAFWLWTAGPKEDPMRFEIDIAEAHYPNEVHSNLHNWSGEHWAKSERWLAPANLSHSYHVYGVEWNETELIWYFDGHPIRRLPHRICLREAQIRLSTAVLTSAGEISDALNGTSMDVDYVRVYRKKGP